MQNRTTAKPYSACLMDFGIVRVPRQALADAADLDPTLIRGLERGIANPIGDPLDCPIRARPQSGRTRDRRSAAHQPAVAWQRSRCRHQGESLIAAVDLLVNRLHLSQLYLAQMGQVAKDRRDSARPARHLCDQPPPHQDRTRPQSRTPRARRRPQHDPRREDRANRARARRTHDHQARRRAQSLRCRPIRRDRRAMMPSVRSAYVWPSSSRYIIRVSWLGSSPSCSSRMWASAS